MENEFFEGQEQPEPEVPAVQEPPAESEHISQPELSDDGANRSLNDGSLPEIEIQTFTVSDFSSIAISSISIGVLSGAIFMIIGLTVLGIVKIFQKL